jgi:tetratricopeptide (TPR) repeat protein
MRTIKQYSLTLFLILVGPLNASHFEKFALRKIGIKINKPEKYILITHESAKQIRNNSYKIIDWCGEDKTILNEAIKNTNYNILLNTDNLIERITITRTPKLKFTLSNLELIESSISKQCITIKNSNFYNIKKNNGKTKIGDYFYLLNQITNSELSYFSESFIINARNSTIIVTINTLEKKSNLRFINDIEFISSFDMEKMLEECDSLITNENFQNAENKINTALTLDPLNLLCMEKKASLSLKNKNYHIAIEDANKIKKQYPNNINAYIISGISYYHLNKNEDAVKEFKQAQSIHLILSSNNNQNEYYASFYELYGLIGEALLKEKKSILAKEYFDLALNYSIDSLETASILYNLGFMKSEYDKNPKEAIYYYTRAIDLYPNNALKRKSEAFFNRGLNKRFMDDFEGAIADYTMAITCRPDYIKAINNRGFLKLKKNDLHAAINDFTLVIELDNNATSMTKIALGNRGFAKITLHQDGCQDLKRAIKLGNESVIEFFKKNCE